MTFVSWTLSTNILDLRTHRSQVALQRDIEMYFVKSGEWVLDVINATKQVTDGVQDKKWPTV